MSKFLLNGSDVLAANPDFKLIGRKDIVNDLCAILTQSAANSVIVSGPGGVGISALAYALQARKLDDDAPFDIVNKRFFWLDTDGLFALGDNTAIVKELQAIFGILNRTPDSVMIVEDTLDLIEALRNSGLMHVINALTSMVKGKKTQLFLEVRESDLDKVFQCHSDFREHFTLKDIVEPVGDELLQIVKASARSLENSYKVSIADSAIAAAIAMTTKYRSVDTGINRAQPERSRLLLDASMAKYCLYAHSVPPMLPELEAALAKLEAGSQEYDTQTKIQAIKDRIESHTKEFLENQRLLKSYFREQRTAEKEIIVLEERIVRIQDTNKAEHDQQDDPIAAAAGYTSPEIEAHRKTIAMLQNAVAEHRLKFEALTKTINEKLQLTGDHVVDEFSRISGIEVAKLKQDDKIRLVNLGNVLKKRVYGQDQTLDSIYRSIKIWKRGRRTGKPLPLLLCGPSGVGKTEICRSLSEGLFDTVSAMNKFDMGGYMERNDATKLIGAPPGYEGFEAGGELTRTVRANPYQLILLDEVEKAHKAIFDVFLGILDEGTCKDNIGRMCDFGDIIMPFTTNIGQEHMLKVGTGGIDSISHEEAYNLTMRDLEAFFKPEFLNRFDGRENIYILNRLEIESIQRIAYRELERINNFFAPKIQAEFPKDQLDIFCKQSYSPKIGARGIPAKIKLIEGMIIDEQFLNEDISGTMQISYDTKSDILKPIWRQNDQQAA